MTRFALGFLFFAGLAVGCERQHVSPSFYDHLVLALQTVDTTAGPAARAGGGSPDPAQAGRDHNAGYLELFRTHQWTTDVVDFFEHIRDGTGEDWKQVRADLAYRRDASPADGAAQLVAGGADPLAAAGWRILAEADRAAPSGDYAAGVALADSLQGAVSALGALGDADTEIAMASIEVFRYSLALHAGAELDGVNYAVEPLNIGPNLGPEHGILMDLIKIALADMAGYIAGGQAGAVAASTIELIDQIGEDIDGFMEWMAQQDVVESPPFVEIDPVPGIE